MIVKWDMTPREMAEAIMGGATELFFEAREAIEEGLSAAPFCKDMFFELCLLLEEKHTAAGCNTAAGI